MDSHESNITRRRVIAGASVSGLAALAGCTSTIQENTRFLGDDTDDELHEHGYIYLELDDEPVDFGDERYLLEESNEVDSQFHFHEYDEDARWHMHEVRITLAEALEELPVLGYTSEEGSHALTIEDETYVDGGDAEISIANREDDEIDPESYELRDEDIFEITVETI
jgi:hypothetical protein